MSKITLADNHCHISKESFESPLEEVKRLKKDSNLEYIVVMGTDYDNNLENLQLKEEFNDDFLKIGFGLHPEEVIKLARFSNHELERVKIQIQENKDKIDYIGEIGIDFTYPESKQYKKEQIKAFKEMCKLAKELEKPVSIHARESFEEVIEVVEEVFDDNSKFNGFLHCFTGTFEQGMFFIEKGFKLGLGGIVTYKSAQDLRQVVKELIEFYPDKDFNDLFGLETDTPYLSPEPVRSEKNNPENIKIIAEFVENLLG
jgi:TatD DNase family protein